MTTNRLLIPKTVNELLSIVRKTDEFLLIAGGTYQRVEPYFEGIVISLMSIDDLQKMSTSSSSIYYGSCMSLKDVKNDLQTPTVIKSAISQMFPYYIQSVATIGGNLFANSDNISLLPLLGDMGCGVEVRRLGKSRYDNMDIIDLQKDEIISLIKLKKNRFNIEYFKILGNYGSVQNVALSILGNVYLGIVSELHINLYFSNLPNISIALNQFVNKKLPIYTSDITSVLDEILDLTSLKKWSKPDYYYYFIEKEIKSFLSSL